MHAFLPGSGPLTPLYTLRRTHPGEKQGKREKKKEEKKEKKEKEEEKKKRPIFVCVVLSFSCMLRLAGVRE